MWHDQETFSCKLFSPILSQAQSSISFNCIRSWACSRTEPLVWSLPIPSNDSHPVLRWCTRCHGGKSLQICHLSHISTQGVAFQTRQNCPEKNLQLSLLFLCSSPSVACSEVEEMRQGWIVKAGGLESTNWSQHPEQAVMQKRLKNHKVITSSSLQLLFPLYFCPSRPLLHHLSYHWKNERFPYSPLLEHSKRMNSVFHTVWYHHLTFPWGPRYLSHLRSTVHSGSSQVHTKFFS